MLLSNTPVKTPEMQARARIRPNCMTAHARSLQAQKILRNPLIRRLSALAGHSIVNNYQVHTDYTTAVKILQLI